MKAAKEKHVNFIIDVLKGHYFEMMSSNKATEKIFDTLFKNLKSISVVNKILSILHRALQEVRISTMIALKIKEKESLLFHCLREPEKENSEDIRMQIMVTDLYIEYIKTLVNFVCVSQLFSIRLSDLLEYAKTFKTAELFKILSLIDLLIE